VRIEAIVFYSILYKTLYKVPLAGKTIQRCLLGYRPRIKKGLKKRSSKRRGAGYNLRFVQGDDSTIGYLLK